MNNKLLLHVPTISELWYRQQILSDPETMNYNKGYDLDIDDYHKDTGCMDFPEDHWEKWFHWFVNGKPQRFYAYIIRKVDNAFIGEVNVHRGNQDNWYDMGIVIESKYRGKGYAVEALNLLLKEVFENMSVLTIKNTFESNRISAIKAHISSGFQVINEHNGMITLCITKEEFYAKKL